MIFCRRTDGERVKGESVLRNMMPYLLPRRNDSVVFFEQQIDVTNILQYLADRPQLTFFHVVLASIVRAVYKWPKANRFVSGGKLYQRNKVVLSFVVKKKMHPDAGMTAVKREFEASDTIFDVAQKVDHQIKTGRSHKRTSSESEMSIVMMLPGFIIRFLFWLQRLLDGWNILPSALTRNDPMYTGIFMANLGSIGISAPFHHLYEYGTASMFGAIGKVAKMPVVNDQGQVVARDMVTIRWTADERIIDGYYLAQALALFEQHLHDPISLETVSVP